MKSNRPWSTKTNADNTTSILNREGRLVAVFKEWEDAEDVVELCQKINELQSNIDELRDEVQVLREEASTGLAEYER